MHFASHYCDRFSRIELTDKIAIVDKHGVIIFHSFLDGN